MGRVSQLAIAGTVPVNRALRSAGVAACTGP
jgi:hypothetical protein